MRAYAGRQFAPFLWWSLVWPGREANSRPTVREADTLPTEPPRHGTGFGLDTHSTELRLFRYPVVTVLFPKGFSLVHVYHHDSIAVDSSFHVWKVGKEISWSDEHSSLKLIDVAIGVAVHMYDIMHSSSYVLKIKTKVQDEWSFCLYGSILLRVMSVTPGLYSHLPDVQNADVSVSSQYWTVNWITWSLNQSSRPRDDIPTTVLVELRSTYKEISHIILILTDDYLASFKDFVFNNHVPKLDERLEKNYWIRSSSRLAENF